MAHVKVKDHNYLARDEDTDQILNTNNMEYNQYIARRAKRTAERAKAFVVDSNLDEMKNDLDNVKNEISEIKSLLKEVVNGK